jgi:ribosomal protein L9
METSKVDEFTIEVTKETVQTVVQKYDYNFLIAQEKAIQADLDRYTAERRAELAEVRALKAECKKLGIVAKPADKTEVL